MRWLSVVSFVAVVSVSCSPFSKPQQPAPVMEEGVDGGSTGGGAAGGGSPTGGGGGGGAMPMDSGVGGGSEQDAGAPDAGCSCQLPSYCDAAERCVLDTTPPTVTVQAAPNASNTMLDVTGTASDGQTGVASVTVRLGNMGTPIPVTLRNGIFATSVPVSLSGEVNSFTVVAEARDGASIAAIAQADIIIDAAPPSITIEGTDANCSATACTGVVLRQQNGSSFELNATVIDGVALAPSNPVMLRVLEGATELLPSTPMPHDLDNDYIYFWPVPMVDGRFYTFEVTATDSHGNSATARRIVLVDRMAPRVVFLSPTSGALVGGTSFSLAFSVVEGHTLAAVEFAPSNEGPWGIPTFNPTQQLWSAQLPNPIGDYVLSEAHARARDLAGNEVSVGVAFLVDNVPPTLTATGPADVDCGGDVCTGAVVNGIGPLPTWDLQVTDGSPSPLSSTCSFIRTMNSVAQPCTVLGGFGRGAPRVAGEAGGEWRLQFEVTDSVGNRTVFTRRVWMDTVAPTATLPVSGQRLVVPLAPMVTFSELMSVSSVRANAVFTPSVDTSSLNTVEGRTFSFQSLALAGYTPYSLSVVGSTDKAGNPVASGQASFLTAPRVLAANTVVAAAHPSPRAWRAPVVVVDADGLPVIDAVLDMGGGVIAPQHFEYTGASAFRGAGGPAVVGANELWPTHSVISGSSQLADGRLQNTVEVLFHNGTNASFLRSTRTTGAAGSWSTPSTSVATMNPPSRPMLRPMLELVRFQGLGISRLDTTVVAPSVGASAMNNATANGGASTWSVTTMGPMTNWQSLNGRATIEGLPSATRTLRFWDGLSSSVVATDPALGAAVGRPQLKSASPLGTTTSTAAYVAYALDFISTSRLSIVCSATPLAATPNWLAGHVTLPRRVDGTPLASALTATRFVVAGEFGGSVHVYAVPQSTACSAAPAPTLVGTIANARDPGVTVDAQGTVWVATVSTASGVLQLNRF